MHLSRKYTRVAWASNQNKLLCDSPSRIWQRLRVSGNCMGAYRIRRQCGWPCKLSHGKSNLHPPPLPQGRAIHPRHEWTGLSGSLTVIIQAAASSLGTPSMKEEVCFRPNQSSGLAHRHIWRHHHAPNRDSESRLAAHAKRHPVPRHKK